MSHGGPLSIFNYILPSNGQIIYTSTIARTLPKFRSTWGDIGLLRVSVGGEPVSRQPGKQEGHLVYRHKKLTLHIRRRRWLTPEGKSLTSWTTSSLVQQMHQQNHSTPRWKPSVLSFEVYQIYPSSCIDWVLSSDNRPRRYNWQKWLVIVTFVVGDGRREEGHFT